MRCVEGALGLSGHVVIGVVRLVARFHHAYAIPSVDFFPSGFESQTVFCDRQFHLYPNSCTLLHRENGSFDVLSLHKGRLDCDEELGPFAWNVWLNGGRI